MRRQIVVLAVLSVIAILVQAEWPSRILGVSCIYVLYLILWELPKHKISSHQLEIKDKISLENDIRSTLAQIIGGALVLFGLYFTAQNLKNSQQTLAVAQQGQITERFTRAVEQLGKSDERTLDSAGKEVGLESNLAIRLGGIYALNRIAKESEQDRRPIVEILTTYVRSNAPSTVEKKPVKPDIQAIVEVLSQSWGSCDHDMNQRAIDLSLTDLNSLRLFKACLTGWHLNSTHLEWAQLTNANLEGADLSGALMNYAYLNNANMKGVSLSVAQMQGSHLEGADLTGAVGLTCDQIKSAIIDDHTILAADLRECWQAAKNTKP